MLQETNPKILIVDDNPAGIDFMIELLKDFDVAAVTGVPEARKAIGEEHPDLILLDIRMPGIDGFAFCEELKADKKTREIPVVFLTASHEDDDIARAIELGGVDYITKPYKAAVVSLRIKTQLELVALRRKVRAHTVLDDRTVLHNGRILKSEGKRWFDFAVLHGHAISLGGICIDNLKTINAAYGIDAADEVIRSVAKLLKKREDQHHLIARMGGGLFMVLSFGQKASQLLPVLETLKQEIESLQIPAAPDAGTTVRLAAADNAEAASFQALMNEVLTECSVEEHAPAG